MSSAAGGQGRRGPGCAGQSLLVGSFLGNLALEAISLALLVQDSSRRALGYIVGALQRHRSSAAVVASTCVGLANLALLGLHSS